MSHTTQSASDTALREQVRLRYAQAAPAATSSDTPGSCCTPSPSAALEHLDGLAAAGFTDASVDPTHEVASGLHGAIVKATKPAAQSTPTGQPEDATP